MKISMKILAASVALATLTMSGAANASIAMTDQYISGELYLTAFDSVGQQTYSRDLGVYQTDFLADTSKTLSYNLNTLDTGAQDTNWAKFITSGNKGVGVVYTITSGNYSYTSYPSTGPYAQYGAAYGFLVSSPSTIADIANTAPEQSNLSGVIATIKTFAGASNASAGDTKIATTAMNNSGYAIPTDTGYFTNIPWGGSIGSFMITGNIDNDIPFYSALIDVNDGIKAIVTKLPNVWKLTKAGDLTYKTSAVPVPAALWLFGSGLLGLVSVARRRKV